MMQTAKKNNPLGLYIHIPFCAYRCRYCNFSFVTSQSSHIMQRVLDNTLHECMVWWQRLENPTLRTIYIGGGTPSIIPIDMFANFLRALHTIIFVNGDMHEIMEYTIEANPEGITVAALQMWESLGISRISLGVQSFHDESLQILGRRANRVIIDTALEHIAHVWNGAISIDILSGIPQQTCEMRLADMQCAVATQAPHISLYDLIVEKHTSLWQMRERGEISMPDEVQELAWIDACDALIAAGYQHYEISNFAKKGYESIHNSAYWQLQPYLGIGPGAVSTLFLADEIGATRVVRRENPSVFHYELQLKQKTHTAQLQKHEYELSAAEFFFEHWMLGLRCVQGVNFSQLYERFGITYADMSELIAKWDEQNFLAYNSPIAVNFTREARQYLNRIVCDVFDYIPENITLCL